MSTYESEIQEWWQRRSEASEVVRSVMDRQWYDTGRPKREIMDSVIELLNIAKEYEDFKLMYIQLMGDTKEEYVLDYEATCYFRCYMHGKIVGITEFNSELKEKVFDKI